MKKFFWEKNRINSAVLKTIIFMIVVFLLLPEAKTAEPINIEKLATAIYYAEGGAKTNHPYGILTHYKHTTARQACSNTINSALKRFTKQDSIKDFIHFLSLTYCPIGCDNDNGTNKFWERNVKYFYYKQMIQKQLKGEKEV